MATPKKGKKHIYSDTKKMGIDTKVASYYPDLHNNAKKIQALYHLPPSDWLSYISRVMYDKEQIKREDIYEDTSYILNEINDSNLERYILKNLMKEENFNPFVDFFPLYIFNESTKNFIKKKQSFIKDYGNYLKIFQYNNFNIMMKYNDNRIDFKECHKFIDILILFNSYSVIISLSKNTKSYFDLSKLYEQFNDIEPNIWQMNSSKTMLYVKKGKKTKLNIYVSQELIEECLNYLIIKPTDEYILKRNSEYIKSLINDGFLIENNNSVATNENS